MAQAADPTTAEWAAAWMAAGLVVAVGGLHLVRPVLGRSPATAWGRLGGYLLAVLSVALVLGAAVAATAGVVAGGPPAGPFAGRLVHADPSIAANVGAWAVVVLVPAAAVLGVLALAAVAVGRPSGLRAAAGLACGVVLAIAAFLVTGDSGPVVTPAAAAILVVAALAAGALVVDELDGRRGAGP